MYASYSILYPAFKKRFFWLIAHVKYPVFNTTLISGLYSSLTFVM